MIHLKPIDDDAVSFIRNVIDHKKRKHGEKEIVDIRKACERKGMPAPSDLTYPERCKKIFSSNQEYVEAYDKDFKKDKWGDIVSGIPVTANSKEKDHAEFQELYSYGLSAIVKYREKLSRLNNGRTATCPICEASAANTLDHYIPQTKYPLYVVHPRNLIPCCSECNGHKLGNVLDANNDRQYWDAFIDQQPTEQYLFCKVTGDGNGLLKCEYDIVKGKVDDKTWYVINKTFDDFHFKEKYREQAKVIVNELRDKIITPIRDSHLSLTQSIEIAKMFFTSSSNINNWEFVTKKALLESDAFKGIVAAELSRLGISYTI